MTDPLAADVERWLATEVRTTWPGKSGDCCDTEERADLAQWFAAQIRAFETWNGKPRVDLDGWHLDAAAHFCTPDWVIADKIMREADEIANLSPRPMKWTNLDANVRHYIAHLAIEALHDAGYVIGRLISDARIDGDTVVRPVTATEPPNSTQGPPNPNRGTQSIIENPEYVYHWPTPLPPPKPGTHESDLCHQGTLRPCAVCFEDQRETPHLSPRERREFHAAAKWSYDTAHKENT